MRNLLLLLTLLAIPCAQAADQTENPNPFLPKAKSAGKSKKNAEAELPPPVPVAVVPEVVPEDPPKVIGIINGITLKVKSDGTYLEEDQIPPVPVASKGPAKPAKDLDTLTHEAMMRELGLASGKEGK